MIEAPADGARARRDVHDARAVWGRGSREQRRESLCYSHGPHDVGVEAGVHAFAAAGAGVGNGGVVDEDV